MNRFLILCAVSLVGVGSAKPHDFWTTGEPVPPWVKSACCGPSDVHHLKMSAIHIMPDGLHIDGIETVVPMSRVLPSPDGTAWAFWNPVGEPDPVVFCMFYPLSGT